MTTIRNEDNRNDRVSYEDPHEEIKYLKSKLKETQSEFQEFQESSRDLEAEYETQIEQLEKKNTDASNQITRLEDELDQLRTKYNTCTNDTQHKLNEYQRQIAELTTLNERLTSYIRELEQNNDDLERAQRALAASLEDFEGQLNQQIERNVLLENEISEKEELECIVQRLKEETRDLRQELTVNSSTNEMARKKQMTPDSSVSVAQTGNSINNGKSDSVETLEAKLAESNLNGFTPSTADNSKQSVELPQENGSFSQGRSSTIDSTTSPMTPPSESRFSFSSLSYNRIPPARSTDSKSQQTSSPSSPRLPAIVMSPSTRISALNIVSDLLRKVGAMESKLSSAKKMAS